MKAIDYAKASVETMMRKFAAADLPPKGRFHYHQGVFLSGVYQTYERCGDTRYFDYVKDWVDSCINEKGEILEYDQGQMDDMQPGILLYHLLKATGDSRYETPLHTLCPLIYHFVHNEDGGLWHKNFRDHQMWLDGLYMGGPICAEYGKTFNHPEYFDFVAKQILLMRDHCKDDVTGLWHHAYDDSRAQEWADPVTGKSPEFWGRSIGWVPVAILDDLDFIPEDHPKRAEIEALTRDLLIAITNYQSEDGRWYQVVNKGDQPDNWLENSCSCLYVAALIKAVRKGLLDPSYLEVAKKGYEGVIRSLSWEGEDLIVGNVCIGTGVGDYAFYVARPTSANDLHGVGAFLLMCAQAADIDL